MITVHHLNNSRSHRVLWLLEELEMPYDLKIYQRDPKTMLAPPSLRQVHPLGKSPVLTDGSATIAESAPILDYILDLDGQGRMRPSRDSAEWRKFNYWMHYAEGSLMPPLLLSLVFARLPKQPMPFFVRPVAKGISDKVLASFVAPQLSVHLDFLESELEKSTWFAGTEFTAADIQMSFPVEAAAARGGMGARPRLKAFLDRIRSRPAYRRAIDRGGPFDLLS